MRKRSGKASNFPYDQKKFATLRILKSNDGQKSNISQLLHTTGLTTNQRGKYNIILHEMRDHGWITISGSKEHSGTKIIQLTSTGSDIADAIIKLLDEQPKLEEQTKVFRMTKIIESDDNEDD